MSGEVVGTVGVALLLFAFVLNLLRFLSERSVWYLLMNFVGAGLAFWYAWTGGLIPFMVLEGVWALTALIRLLLLTRNPRPAAGG